MFANLLHLMVTLHRKCCAQAVLSVMQVPVGSGAAVTEAASCTVGGSQCLLFRDLDAGTRYCEERFLEVRRGPSLACGLVLIPTPDVIYRVTVLCCAARRVSSRASTYFQTTESCVLI